MPSQYSIAYTTSTTNFMDRDDSKTASLLLTALISVVAIIAFFTPFSSLVFGTAQGTFTASATIGNSAPSITVASGQTITSAAATSRLVNISFTATDTNGYTDLNDSTAQIAINRSGETTRTSSGCTVMSHPDSQSTLYNCTLTLWYYDAAGPWTINASVADNSLSNATNTSITVTVNNIDAVSAVSGSIAFSGSPGTTANAASPNPQQLNNTGNQDYNTLNITGLGFVSGSNTLNVGNVSFNWTNSATGGQRLINNTAVVMVNSSLAHGLVATKGIYFFLDVPNGQAPGSYNAQGNWVVDAIQ